MSRAPSRTRPAVGSTNPPIMRSVVVLPHPLGPSRTTSSPSSIASETSRTNQCPPHRLHPPSTRSRDTGSEHRGQPDVPVRENHAGGDDEDLEERHGRDDGVDAPLEVLAEGGPQGRAARPDPEQ